MEPIGDTYTYLKDWLKKYPYAKIAVGTDSQKFKKRLTYVTIIAIFYPTIIKGGISKNEIEIEYKSGAHLLYRKSKVRAKGNDLWTRLWKEVEDTREVAEYIKNNFYLYNAVEAHLDINADEHYQSNKLFQSAVGYLKSFEFIVKTKPDGWVASCAADALTRN